MPITNTQEVYEIRSISNVIINPSIMEGTQQYESILGPDRAISIIRYPPIFLVAPLLTGDPGIPSVLHCSPGVVDASPSAYREYNWFIDGVLSVVGVGPAFQNFQTDSLMDNKTITCGVRAINQVGEAYAISNGIDVNLIEPVVLGEYQWYTVTGAPTEDLITVYMDQIFLLTGMWVDEVTTMFSDDVFPITGLGLEDHIGLTHYDTYSAQFLTWLDNVTVGNHNAESDLSGWTVTSGTVLVLTHPQPFGAGTKVWRAIDDPNIFTSMQRTSSFAASNNDEIDAGIAWVNMSFYCTRLGNATHYGPIRGYYQILDASDVVLSTHDFFEDFEPDNNISSNLSNFWQLLSSPPTEVPVGGRKIRTIFQWPQSPSNVGNICLLDEISVTLYKTL